MVEKIELLLILLGVVGVLAVVAERWRQPVPILLVLAGVAIALIPGLPEVKMDPELVLLIFLPPLIFSAAWNFPWEDFRSNLIPIFGLAVGLVFATMTGVAYAAQWLVPGLTLAVGFVLGAIVSPPDAVSASAILKNLRVPKRLSTVLEGESLVNDSSSLVAYQFAVAAVVTGSFSFAQAGGDFLWQSLGGALFGWVVGLVIAWIHRGLNDPAVELTLTILTPYIAYLPCEKLGCSGVLAVVAAGIHLGHRSWETLTPETRLQRETIWRFIDFLLNGVVFIMMGLQFPGIIKGIDHVPFYLLALLGLAVSLVVVVIRFAWVFPMALIQKLTLPGTVGNLSAPGLFVASWAGMRGVVSLAAAMALPETTASGEPFPYRQLILFLTFSVIFFTLVGQGLSLPWLIRKLKVEEKGEDYQSEAKVRVILLRNLIAEIERLLAAAPTEAKKASLGLWRDYYTARLHHIEMRLASPQLLEPGNFGYELALFPQLLQHVREDLTELRRRGEISEETRKHLEFDFDLEERRIQHLLEHFYSSRIRRPSAEESA